MNWLKNGNLAKLVAFFVIAVILICAVAFVASGWQDIPQDSDSSDAGNENGSTQNGEADGNTNTNDHEDPSTENGEPDTPVISPIPEYLHKLTGTQTDSVTANSRPICFVIDSSAPNYGISSSHLTIEIPTEDGKTRFVIFTNDASTLGKIGSIAPTRDYITRLMLDFGGIPISLGNDDRFEYGTIEHGDKDILDLIENAGYHYTEYSNFAYSNADLIKALIKNSNINNSFNDNITMPYIFNDYFNSPIIFDESVSTVTVSYSSSNSTSFVYNKETGCFTFMKNGSEYKDLLNDKSSEYKNLFMLFADSTTYETSDAIETVIDTENCGSGVYITEGSKVNITWKRNQNGNLIFYNSDGEILTVNRGTSYISFIKSSNQSSVEYK